VITRPVRHLVRTQLRQRSALPIARALRRVTGFRVKPNGCQQYETTQNTEHKEPRLPTSRTRYEDVTLRKTKRRANSLSERKAVKVGPRPVPQDNRWADFKLLCRTSYVSTPSLMISYGIGVMVSILASVIKKPASGALGSRFRGAAFSARAKKTTHRAVSAQGGSALFFLHQSGSGEPRQTDHLESLLPPPAQATNHDCRQTDKEAHICPAGHSAGRTGQAIERTDGPPRSLASCFLQSVRQKESLFFYSLSASMQPGLVFPTHTTKQEKSLLSLLFTHLPAAWPRA
jgi:hypothetical protein